MQSLEKNEDPFKVLRINPEAVVAYGKDPFIATVFRGGDMYARDFGTVIFDCVPDKVLKYLTQLRFIRLDSWQGIMCNNGTTLVDRCSQVCKRFFQSVFNGNLAERLPICPRARVSQQIPDQSLHTVATVYRKVDELIGVRVQTPFVAPG